MKYKIIEIDPYLKPYEQYIDIRMKNYQIFKNRIVKTNERISDFANGHLFFGFHKLKNGCVYREWAPAADSLYLIGNFNDWNGTSHPLMPIGNGAWEIVLDDASIDLHNTRVKVKVNSNGKSIDRIPLYIKRAVQDENSYDYSGVVWLPDKEFQWTDGDFKCEKSELFIYECHVGMAQEREGIGTFKEFTENILPWIKESGYTAIQLMAIAEHPYYGSFGYHVSNFFAVSSRFGTPDELKELINTAHSMGLAVFLDLVHSHAVKNINEGINEFDGTDYQFFHTGSRGEHPAWDSKLFNYGKPGVVHFLLSNIKFWIDEYHFDGFRFDGVTSMIYHNNGLGICFDNYGKYFGDETNSEALTYLQLATELVHEVKPHAIAIAEDMSGMPGMCLPIPYGGIGFDFRLSMGVPDFWIKTLKEVRDEDWDLRKMWYELTTRRIMEKNISYTESHDQALVGDKTVIFWLADKEMYFCMSKEIPSLIIDRAIALHKLIRFVTISLGGEGYLNFMGNEFGHPEWIDFPREGNNRSYKYARRQWHLVKDGNLRYEYLYNFDKAMIKLIKDHSIFEASDTKNIYIDQEKLILAYKKGELIFLFNFHPVDSQPDFFVNLYERGNYQVIFSSDDPCFGGFDRISKDYIYSSDEVGFKIYIPNRVALVLKKLN